MNLKEIVVGGEYYAGGTAMGRARVIAAPERRYEGGRTFDVEVEYPDALPTTLDSRRKTKIDTKDILRYWNDHDQHEFERHRQRIEDKRGWEEELSNIGIDGNVSMGHGDGMTITFRGYNAERVLEKLIGIEFPEEQKIRNARA